MTDNTDRDGINPNFINLIKQYVKEENLEFDLGQELSITKKSFWYEVTEENNNEVIHINFEDLLGWMYSKCISNF